MKKTYKNPEMEIIKLKIHQHLLDTSSRGFGEDVTDTSGADVREDEGFEW